MWPTPISSPSATQRGEAGEREPGHHAGRRLAPAHAGAGAAAARHLGDRLVTALLALHTLGVNITPLLAGASVVGLAISFGSQSLVKDIVSGFFFLADDAFRVGEYIECGKAKGTVEGFTLRSIRLRHQDGQLHTVPFGQLGEITNYSRDWATVKFEVMLDREVDLEKVSKAAKRWASPLRRTSGSRTRS